MESANSVYTRTTTYTYIFCTPVWLNYEKQEEFIKEICRRKSTKSLRRAGNEGRRNNDNEYARIANRKQGKTP
jgi:hypothetical protein